LAGTGEEHGSTINFVNFKAIDGALSRLSLDGRSHGGFLVNLSLKLTEHLPNGLLWDICVNLHYADILLSRIEEALYDFRGVL